MRRDFFQDAPEIFMVSRNSPFSKELLQKIDRETSVKGVYPNVQRSLKRLIEQHLVTQISKGEYEIEKPGFKEYLMKIFN